MQRQYTDDVIARFWAKVDTSGECWIWTGYRKGHDYGRLSIRHRNVKAHHVAWEIVAGPIPDGGHVLHTCDLVGCVRNDEVGVYTVAGKDYPRYGHLWLGDHDANMADKTNKGRARTVSKGPDRRAILTSETIPLIRVQYAAGASITDLAQQYGVSRVTIYFAATRRSWKHVP